MRKEIFILCFLSVLFVKTADAINLDSGFDKGKSPANQITPDCSQWSGNLSCADADQQAVDNAFDQFVAGTTGIKFTDGVNTVSSATQLTVTGGTIGGTTPNATLSITGGGSGNVGIGTSGNPAYYATNGSTVSPFINVTYAGSNVGIGTSVPNALLKLGASSNFYQLLIDNNNSVLSTLDSGTNSGTTSTDVIGKAGTTNLYAAQPFTLPTSSTVTKLTVLFAPNTGSPSGTVNCAITTGGPPPTAVSAGAGYSVDFTPTPSALNTILFSGIALPPAVYSAVCQANTSQSANTAWNIYIGNSTGVSTYGSYFNNGSWTLDGAGYNWAFTISGFSGETTVPLGYTSMGNLGIGTLLPGQSLDVNGTARMIGFIDTTNPTNNYVMTSDANGNGTWQVASGGSSQWTTTNVSSVYLPSPGNVGIGSINPGQRLDVNGSARVTQMIDTGVTASKVVLTNGSQQFVGASNVQDLAYCQTGGTNCPGSISGFANPTGTIGLSAVNGSATTAMRSDATPALGVTISPTMTGNWIFAPSSGNTVFTAGNVGIGTAIPPNLLYVAGTAEMQGFKMNNAPTNNYVLTSDANGVGTWKAASGGVSSITGDSYFINNSASTGSVTLTAATHTQNTVIGAATSTTPTDLAMPSCATSTSALQYTTNTGFSCGTISGSSQWTTTNTNDVYLPNNGNIGIGTTKTTTAALTVMNGNVGIGTWKPANLLAIGTNANQFQIGAGGNIAELSGNTNANMSSTIIQLNNSGGQIQLKNSGNGTNSGTLIIGSTGGTSGSNIELRTSTGNDSAGFIKMTGGNSGGTEIARFTDGGNVGIGSTTPGQLLDVKGTLRLTGIGHISSNGVAPTVASNACGSTTQGVVVAKSTDISGTVTVGALTVTSCAITFASTWQNAPVCVANDDTNVLAIRPTETTTGITFTSLSSASGDNISWICIGNE